jgi:hypothetical protein
MSAWLLCCAQILSLLKEYDVVWPQAAHQWLTWAEVFNLGLAITAPECYIANYSFYSMYTMTIAFPVVMIALCVMINAAAHLAHKALRHARWGCTHPQAGGPVDS